MTGSSWKDRARLFVPPILPRAVGKVGRLFRARAPVTPSLEAPALADLFPGIESLSVRIALRHIPQRAGNLPLNELVVLAAICGYLKPRRVFEIGTYLGSSALAMAMQTGPDAEIFTLDLASHDAPTRYPVANGEITGVPFEVGALYRGTPEEGNIRQLFGDSASFDFKPFHESVDLVFIDGSHTYENVKLDTENAWRMLCPGGVAVWDDYHPDLGPGVMRVLHETSDRRVFQIAGTRLAVHRSEC